MNVKISENQIYTVDVMENDSAVNVVEKAVLKHNKSNNNSIDYDKIK